MTRLNERLPGLELRLPTEAEWEYACRAGTATARYHDNLHAIAWYYENSDDGTHEVSEKQANAWGLYDMLGNVFEWCHDGPWDYARESVVEPVGSTAAGADRVFRGGGWYDHPRNLRAAFRYWYRLDNRNAYLGFRCASSSSNGPVRTRETFRESKRWAEPAETAKRLSAARLLHLQGQPAMATRLPDDDGFHVITDRDRLRFGRIVRPSWATEIGRDIFGLWVRFDVDGIHQRLRWIPPGRFQMGSPPDEPERFESEGPCHEVAITHGFWLFATPCTQALWETVMGRNPSRFKGARRSVEQVSWEDCQGFMARLNERLPGLEVRLPTEAEWEYACRAGTATTRYQDNLDAIAWYRGNSNRETHEVGEKLPNAWGLYDMLGNVYEWCHDGRREYGAESVVDPMGSTEAGALRVIRGGGWRDLPQLMRAAYRHWRPPGIRYGDLGFRCASSG